jgi:hypothetical protein
MELPMIKPFKILKVDKYADGSGVEYVVSRNVFRDGTIVTESSTAFIFVAPGDDIDAKVFDAVIKDGWAV